MTLRTAPLVTQHDAVASTAEQDLAAVGWFDVDEQVVTCKQS
jgi:hypothetical protein